MAAVTRGISSASGRSTSIPVFLVPAFSRPCSSRPVTSSRSFSSSEPRGKRQTKAGETNKKRGVSAMRGTGPLVNRGLWAYPLPEPVARSRVPKQTDYEDTADHGLWQFFHADRKALVPPEEESSHGRAWSYGELSIKSFEDLHKLYWLCIKEQNQILTRSREMSRVRAGFGDLELEEKRKVVRDTMARIRTVLAERQFKHDEGMALYYEKSLSELLPDQGELDHDTFYTEPREAEEPVEEVEELQQLGSKFGEMEAVRELSPAKKNPKTRKRPLNLKKRVLQ